MTHSFDIDVAHKYGIEAAIIIQNMQHWITRNRLNVQNQFDGRTWTYNSVKAWGDLYPYMKPATVKRVLSELVNCGVLLRGSYNKNPYDHTSWYAFSNEQEWLKLEKFTIGRNPPIEGNETSNRMDESNQSITDINPDINPDTSSDSEESVNPQKEIFSESKTERVSSESKSKKKKARADDQEPSEYPEYKDFIRIWCEAYKEIGVRMPKDGAKIKSLIRQVRQSLVSGGQIASQEATVRLWEHFVAGLGKTWGNGKDLSTIDSKYSSLLYEMKHGKKADSFHGQNSSQRAFGKYSHLT